MRAAWHHRREARMATARRPRRPPQHTITNAPHPRHPPSLGGTALIIPPTPHLPLPLHRTSRAHTFSPVLHEHACPAPPSLPPSLPPLTSTHTRSLSPPLTSTHSSQPHTPSFLLTAPTTPYPPPAHLAPHYGHVASPAHSLLPNLHFHPTYQAWCCTVLEYCGHLGQYGALYYHLLRLIPTGASCKGNCNRGSLVIWASRAKARHIHSGLRPAP